MNKWKIVLTFFIVISMACLVYLLYFYIDYTSLNFKESNKIIQNPSKGFYVQFDTENVKKLDKLKDKNISVVLFAFDIKDYVNSPISLEKLTELENALTMAQYYGLSVIFRAGYGFDSEDAFKDATSTDIIKTHISQLKPIFEKHKAVLLSVQAGFIGPWGEWHSTNLAGENGELSEDIINEIVYELTNAVPSPISVALRRPRFIRALDASQIDLTRIAFHNDALLSGEYDMGTYDDSEKTREDELTYISERAFLGANGGEMTNISDYTAPKQALHEFGKLNLTYLNHEYNKDVLNNWKNISYEKGTFFEHVQKNLGYNLWLKQARLPQSFRPGQKIKIELELFNGGFANFAVPYKTELVVSNGVSEMLYPINLEQTDYAPNKITVFELDVPSTHFDTLEIGVRIYNANEELKNDYRYSVQLSNKNVDFKNGVNFFAKYSLKDSKLVLQDTLK